MDQMKNLVLRAKQGDREAFAILYSEYFNPIYRFIYFQVRQKKDAEDLAQSVFLKALEAIENFREQGFPFSSWLYRIARNSVIDFWKKKRGQTIDDPEFFSEIPDTRALPWEKASEGFRAEYLRKLIQEISEDQKEVILLYFVEGLSYPEIAEITGRSEEAIRALKHRALKSLRAKIDEKYL